jgi:ABC-type antimicrobial peptide transport system permease subunit
MVRDLRYAMRTLARNPGFTVAALLALALGIGANTTVFSVVNGVLLRPLPYPEPERIVWIQDGLTQSSRSRWGACVADFLVWQSRSRSFDPVAAWANNIFNVTGDGEAERVAGFGVTARFFDVLRVRPLQGRTFAPDEDQPGRARVALISERFWERRYGRRPAETMLFGVKPSDAVTFSGVTLVIGVVAMVACVVPAWRAARVDPLVALRHE